MNIEQLSIYKASAGSGKTYALTQNYLRLALRSPDYFQSILAVTFTNKATEEMKSRILETLEKISAGGHSMSSVLMADLQVSEAELKKRSRDLLINILHHYSAFAVATIDAFFQKVVRTFAREIGIQTGFKVELDQPKVLSEVVERLLLKVEDDGPLLSWLSKYAIHRIHNGQAWDARNNIKSLAQELFTELFIFRKDEIFASINDQNKLDEILSAVNKRQQEIEEQYQHFGIISWELIAGKQLSYEDFQYGLTGIGGFIFKLANGEFPEPGKRVLAALDNQIWYKKNADRSSAIDSIKNELTSHLTNAISFYKEVSIEYKSNLQIIEFLYTFGLLARVNDELSAYREQEEMLLIADFPQFLSEIIDNSDTPYIYEKIGARFKHYLIDEFQDTSGLQWQNFKPLVKDSLDAGNYNMVVGDIKQSIYRWRGGNWKLLLDQIKEDVGAQRYQEVQLNVNRRSQRKIIEFNNGLFEFLPGKLESKLADSSRLLNKAYTAVSQDVYEEGDGLVDMTFIDKSEDYDQQVMQRLISILRDLQHARYELKDIAILVRNSREGKKITEGLMEVQKTDQKFRYDVISNESLFIINNVGVHAILRAIQYSLEPSVQLYDLELNHALIRIKKGDQLIALKEAILSLRNQDLQTMVSQLIILFQLENSTEHLPFIMAFQDMLLEYELNENGSPAQFLTWLADHENRSVQILESQNAIKLLTIHKSKGLQYKVVIIPYCQWKLDHDGQHQPILWSDPMRAVNLPVIPIKYKRELSDTYFNEVYQNEKLDIHLDHLNLLYVALTRAEEGLYIMSPRPDKKTLDGVGDLLYDYASSHELINPDHNGTIQFTDGSLSDGFHQTTLDETEVKTINKQPASQSGYPMKVNWSGQDWVDDAVLEAKNYGELVHEILSKIEVREDFKPALEEIRVKHHLVAEEFERLRNQLIKIWELTEVPYWFSGKWQIRNETGILMPDGIMKRPDRVMTNHDTTIIVDYKTGESSESHHRQVQEYMNLLIRMGYDNVSGYLLYLNKPELIAVN